MPTNGTYVVTPQHLAKMLQMVPATTTQNAIHSLFASGTLSDLLSAEPKHLEKFTRCSLWRDEFRKLIGLPAESLRFKFTLGKSAYLKFVRSIDQNPFLDSKLHARLIGAIRKPENAGVLRSSYDARQDITCAWFGEGIEIREALGIAQSFGYRPVSVREYLKLCAYMNKRETRKSLPDDFFNQLVLGGFEEDRRFPPVPPGNYPVELLCAYVRRSPTTRGDLAFVKMRSISNFTGKTWIALEKGPLFTMDSTS